MWNPFKTLTERDSARLRRLERQFNDLADDVALCLDTIPRINARLRQRAKRAADFESGNDSSGDFNSDGDSKPAVASLGESPSASALMSGTAGDRTQLRAQLRSNARSRGLLPQLRSGNRQ